MKTLSITSALVFTFGMLLFPHRAAAQSPNNVPAAAQQAASETESFVERYGIGGEAGVGLNPQVILFGGHGTFGPIFSPNFTFRPGILFGVGEVTTTFGINLDVLYRLPGASARTRWAPYVGAGPNFGLTHKGLSSSDVTGGSGTSTTTTTTTGTTGTTSATTTERNRFNFSDTSFDAGFNFIVGARTPGGVFVELKASPYGVTNVGLLAGFNF